MTTFRGYDRRTILTADLEIGQLINAPGPGCLLPIVRIERQGDTTVLTLGPWESYGRRQYSVARRKTAGQSTIHVRQAPRPAPAGPDACMPATVAVMDEPLSFEDRASVAGQARMASMSAEERGEFARQGANAAHRPANLARRIVKAWPSLSRKERDEVREILRDGRVFPS